MCAADGVLLGNQLMWEIAGFEVVTIAIIVSITAPVLRNYHFVDQQSKTFLSDVLL